MNSYLKKYYDILELPVGSSQKAIKKAYFKLAKQYHPDVNPSPEAQQKFVEINEAYEFLSDPQKVRNILFYYATTKKQKKKREERRAQNIKKKTKQRARASEPEFEKTVSKEALIKDFFKIAKVILIFYLAISSVIFIGYWSDSDSADRQVDFPKFLDMIANLTVALLIVVVFFFIVVFKDYLKDRNSN